MKALNRPLKLGPVEHITLLCLLTLFTRLPFRSSILHNWDSVNFAYGILGLDIIKHRPHPPGYIWYVALGRALTEITGDPNASLVWLSVLAAVLAVLATYAMGKRLFSPRDAFIAALLLIASPLFWYYNEIALTYTLEAFFSVAIAYACYQALDGSIRWAYVAALLLGISGGFRQTTVIVMGPLVLYVMCRQPWRHRLGMGALIFAVCLVWGVPLLQNTDGLGPYLQASVNLSSIVDAVPFTYLLQALGYGLHLVLLLLTGFLLGLFSIERAHLPIRERIFILLWIAPGLLLAVLGHMGQSGYLLYALPVIFIYTPALLRGALERLNQVGPVRDTHRAKTLSRRYGLTILVFLLTGIVTFLIGANSLIVAHDEHWELVQALPSQFPPEETVVLTSLPSNGDFRHASYYMPDYHVYCLAVQEDESAFKVQNPYYVLGWIFHSYQHEDNYDLNPDSHQFNAVLELPPGTTGLLVSERELASALGNAAGNDSTRALSISPVSNALAYVALPPGVRQIVVVDGQLEIR